MHCWHFTSLLTLRLVLVWFLLQKKAGDIKKKEILGGVYMYKNHLGKVSNSVKRDLTLSKTSVEKSKSVYMKINYLT